MQVVLVMFRADGERRSFSITREVTIVGRREDCDLRIPLGDVSRKHCRFVKDDEAVQLEDLESSNGTFHNGEKIKTAMLSPGDTVQIGPVTFLVQIDGVPADDQLQPAAPGGAADNLDFSDTDHADAAAQMGEPGDHSGDAHASEGNAGEEGGDMVELDMEEQTPDDSGT
jgi:pSer/pThr/pTyr-binding forkhead associated (FHA) protein